MSAELPSLESVIEELQPLVGGRIQRVDVIAPAELAIEVRVPGRTLHLLISARPPAPRLHLLPARPPKTIEPGPLQSLLRKRLEGRPLIGLGIEDRVIRFSAAGTELRIRLGAGKDAFQLSDPLPRPDDQAEVPTTGPVPEHFPRSEALAAAVAPVVAKDTEINLRRRLLSRLDAELKKSRRLLARLDEDAKALDRYQDSRTQGELLKTVLPSLKRGQKEATVTDWETGAPRTIPLDPALDPKGNLERLFARAKKADRGRPRVLARQEEVLSRHLALEAERARVQAADLEALLRLAEPGEESREGPAPSKRMAAIDRWSRRFVSLDGHEIRVGRGAAENDRLSFNGARGHDLWLHARGVAGAHVLLRLQKGESPPQDALLDAAHLAVHYSSAKNEARAEVTYVEARYVRKVKGAPPGAVVYSKDKTMLVRMEEGRLRRLLS
ncbi:MAG: NFACT RNA binding domain-containing protein [Myxococcota bacterium]